MDVIKNGNYILVDEDDELVPKILLNINYWW